MLEVGPALTQVHQEVDTLHTKVTSTHMFLNIAVPRGEISIQSSGTCGQSVARLASPDQQLRPEVKEDVNGNISYTVSLGSPREGTPQVQEGMRAKAVPPAVGSEYIHHFKQQLSSLGNLTGEAHDYTTEFHADPTLSTELMVNVGAGGAKLDLSGLNLYKASINSVFSDVWVTYEAPNLCVMKKMDIHAARAKVVLENIEHARAELISVQNDMGETELILGNEASSGSTIYLSSGSGNSRIAIHALHPTKIVIRRGFFARVEVEGDFEIIDKNAFGNNAFNHHEGTYTTIICNTDFGKIFIKETR